MEELDKINYLGFWKVISLFSNIVGGWGRGYFCQLRLWGLLVVLVVWVGIVGWIVRIMLFLV